MPGIVGIATSKKAIQLQKQMLEEMINSVNHRPSLYSVVRFYTDFCNIAQVNLNTWSPSGLVCSEDSSLCGFIDGMIYEHLGKPSLFEMKDQASVLRICLKLYQDEGRKFVNNLNGSFSLFILDKRKERLLIFNDRFGLRPVFYSRIENALLFSSEAKAIWQVSKIKMINDGAIVEFLAFGELHGNKTLFSNIKLIPPGSVLCYSYKKDELFIEGYWELNYIPDYKCSDREFVNQLVNTFTDAVNMRMMGKQHYGISLSGGLDSRAIVAAVDKNKWSKTVLFTFGHANCYDRVIASKVATSLRQKIHCVDIIPKMILDNAQEEVYLSEGMDSIGVSYIVPVHESIVSLVDIVLDGFGMDLTLGGSYLSDSIINANEMQLPHLIYKRRRVISDLLLKKLFRREFQDMVEILPYMSFKKAFEKSWQAKPGNHYDSFLIKNHLRRRTLIGHVLTRTIIENSVPTLDNRFFDIILKIPPEKRINHYLYRKFLMALTPTLSKITYNKTMIMPSAPLAFWGLGEKYLHLKVALKKNLKYTHPNMFQFLRNDTSYANFDEWFYMNQIFKTSFYNLLLGKDSRLVIYLNPEPIKELFEMHGRTESGFKRQNNTMIILRLATIEYFLRLFL